MNFNDHFSSVSHAYASFRPDYPPELLSWLATLPGRRSLAWDCACGTGQATLQLAPYFEKVIGTDASEAQIKEAAANHPKIEWRVAPAEKSGLPTERVDLVTVAQALHWFDLDKFYEEVTRVLHPSGVIAVWCYGVHRLESQKIDALIQSFYSNTVGPFWPPERRFVEEGYRTLPFPFEPIAAPPFHMTAWWTRHQLLGYLRTWSATTRYRAARGVDPVDQLAADLAPYWQAPDQPQRITWPLSLRVGRKRK